MHDLALRYEHLSDGMVGTCPGPDKFAHVCAGLALWLGSAMLLRRPLRSPLPLAIVILFEVVNECVDRVVHGSWMWRDTLGDAAATWFWPFLLTIALRGLAVLRQ